MRLRVLLADDHPDMMTALAHLIEPLCEIVGRIADGADVLDSVARLRPDVLLVDVNMPGLDGIEICRRTVRAFPAVGVIVLTAAVDPALAHAAHDAGATAFIVKLSAGEELPAALEAMRGQR
jgi:DNA-binding NarL/FixJ family response regulator